MNDKIDPGNFPLLDPPAMFFVALPSPFCDANPIRTLWFVKLFTCSRLKALVMATMRKKAHLMQQREVFWVVTGCCCFSSTTALTTQKACYLAAGADANTEGCHRGIRIDPTYLACLHLPWAETGSFRGVVLLELLLIRRVGNGGEGEGEFTIGIGNTSTWSV